MKFKSRNKGNLTVEISPKDDVLLHELTGPNVDVKELLVPIDFSECSKHALRYAISFARQTNARITLISVVNDSRTSFEYGEPEYVANMEQRKRSYSDELAKLVRTQLRGFQVETIVRTGRPDEEIVRAARELDIDLIVISTHGDMGLPHATIGSTAERVVRYASCPVLVVRKKEREFAPPV